MSEIKVGSPVWIRTEFGDAWAEVAVTGETSRSWVLGPCRWRSIKVPKSSPVTGRDQQGDKYRITWSADEVEVEKEKRKQQDLDQAWIRLHRYAISSQVQFLTDISLLRQIAQLIGYKERA